jgi:pyridoxal biosynthesis lyase PdxS
MSDPQMIKEIMDTVTIPVMAKARIGHFVECQVRLFYSLHIPNLSIDSNANRFSKLSA